MKSKIFFLFIIVTLILSAANLNAQVKAGSFTVTPVAGYSWSAKTSIYENTGTYGAAIGYNFSERFGIEATYNILDTEIVPEGVTREGEDPDGPFGPLPAEVIVLTPGGTKVSALQFGLEALIYIYPGEKFVPYAAVGFGTTKSKYSGNSFTERNMPAGFGCKYFITDNIALRADIRAAIPMHDNNIRATVGVTFRFGGK